MPRNDYMLTHKRLLLALSIYSGLYLASFLPIFLVNPRPSQNVGVVWSLSSGLISSVIALAIARIRSFRCAMPEELKAVFFRVLREPWHETRRVGEYVEQHCSRCDRYRHARITAYGGAENDEWIAGRIEVESLPGASVPSL